MKNAMCKKIRPVNIGCITEFPFLDATFDSVTEWQVLQDLGEKINEVIKFVNTTLEKELNEYIVQRFNDMIIDTMYDADTETLVLYLHDSGGDE